MPLLKITDHPTRIVSGLSFVVAREYDQIVVLVSAAAIHEVGKKDPVSDILIRFSVHRQDFVEIAARKFDADQIEPAGHVAIGLQDLAA